MHVYTARFLCVVSCLEAEVVVWYRTVSGLCTLYVEVHQSMYFSYDHAHTFASRMMSSRSRKPRDKLKSRPTSSGDPVADNARGYQINWLPDEKAMGHAWNKCQEQSNWTGQGKCRADTRAEGC